LKNKFFIPSNG